MVTSDIVFAVVKQDQDGQLRFSQPDGLVVTHDKAIAMIRCLEDFYREHTEDNLAAFNKSVLYHQRHPAPKKKYRPSKNKVSGWVYIVQGVDGYYKIGMTTDMEKRLRALATNSHTPLTLVHAIKCRNCARAERKLHKQFSGKRGHGEWFRLNAADLAQLKSLERM